LGSATARQSDLRTGFAIDGISELTEKNMAVRVIIPTPLRVYAAKRDSAGVSAQTVGEALGGLTTQFAELRKHLFTDDGKLRSFVNVYLNDEDIRYMAKEATPVKDGDIVSIVPSIAGGSGASDETRQG
jgi:molybdopterin converting factor small subunit